MRGACLQSGYRVGENVPDIVNEGERAGSSLTPFDVVVVNRCAVVVWCKPVEDYAILGGCASGRLGWRVGGFGGVVVEGDCEGTVSKRATQSVAKANNIWRNLKVSIHKAQLRPICQ